MKKKVEPGCAIKFFFISCQIQQIFAAITLYASAFSCTIKKYPCFSAYSDFFSMLILLSYIDFRNKVVRGQTAMTLFPQPLAFKLNKSNIPYTGARSLGYGGLVYTLFRNYKRIP